MNMFIIDNEVYIRLIFFFGIFLSMAIWEVSSPRRVLTMSKRTRWLINLSLTIFNTFVVRLLFPAAATGIALIAQRKGWGIFNIISMNSMIAGLISIALLDFMIYFQHFVFHHVPILWRLHMVHHTDIDIDVTTGARFHPVEIILSMLIKTTLVIIIGAPVWSVVVFEILLNGTSMFNHSNVFMPLIADKLLRKIVVTPDMHRVHHSVIIKETNSNFGFNFPWWDRLFRTYKDQPVAGHGGMLIGLANFRDAKRLTFPYILALPLITKRMR